MAANSEKTARGRPFQKGQSGNPRGRPKQTQEQKDALAMIRDMAPEAAERLHEIIQDRGVSTKDLLKAIEIVFDRAFGKEAFNGNATNDLLQSLLDLEQGARR